MSPAQTNMYWSLIQRLRDVRRAQGLGWSDSDRHALHKKALGVSKSSKDLTNADLDKIKGAILAIVEPDNLKAQLAALDQPELRMLEARAKCLELLAAMGIAAGETDSIRRDFLRRSYLDGIAKNITRGRCLDFQELNDQQANHILNTLRRRKLAQEQAKAKHAAPDPDNVPF